MPQQIDIPVPMRDGVTLSTDLRLPSGTGPFPAILWRTPYNNTDPGLLTRYVEQGYALVTQDCRGRFDSAGTFSTFDEASDGHDTLAWIAAQPWSNGKVGMVGGSYGACTQFNAAWTNPPSLKAITPKVMGRDLFFDTLYVNGVFSLQLAASWGLTMAGRANQNLSSIDWDSLLSKLPLTSLPADAGYHIPFYDHWLAHPTYDKFWRAHSVEQHYDDISVPAFHFNGWYDLYAEGMLRNFTALAQKHGQNKQKIIIGPWAHSLNTRITGQIDFGPQAIVNLDELETRWLARWVKDEDNGIDREPPVRLFTMGANTWRNESTWPPANAQPQAFFLSSSGRANSLFGDGALTAAPASPCPSDSYTYDPARPVPVLGGNTFGSASGPTDHAPIERRDDVLIYTSPVLTEPLEATGYIQAVLFVSTDAPDTDFVARLCDVYPDGRSIILCDTITRLSFREGFSTPVPAVPGQVYQLTLSLGVTSNVFLPGHKIRLQVTSSCFPRFARNLNTGENFASGAHFRPAHQIVHHSAQHPSRLILPVIKP
jgi:uncharacterized protein